MKKIILLLSLITVLMLATVSAEVYESGTLDGGTGFNEWTVTGFGDLATATPFQLNEDGTITSMSILVDYCYSNSGDLATAGDTVPIKFSIRDTLIGTSPNETTSDLTYVIAGNCTAFVSGVNSFTFDTPLEVTANTTYYFVISVTEWDTVGATYYTDLISQSTGSKTLLVDEMGSTTWAYSTVGYDGDPIFNLTYTVPTPPTGGLTPYTPTHGIGSVTGLLIDFGVEMGVQYILFAGLIAIIGLGIWGYTLYRKGGM